ncbi:dehydrogenase [Legionella parisiensis]|uniref:Uncharacterized protein n=1 Tax=Legionella parisiensis TaxID=45071 RepID=A0A1E5JWJ0_9GAMM|nr:dehydrogenase [Legionella parisiensis]OEH48872.1 hypothetical protein lpari_00119 [Legionella parisiensis]STX75894.1 dehydrogenase [Legionella parisiensis]
MILNITTAQFTDLTLSDIEYSRNIYRSIDFNFGNDADSPINKTSLEKFVWNLKKLPRQKRSSHTSTSIN